MLTLPKAAVLRFCFFCTAVGLITYQVKPINSPHISLMLDTAGMVISGPDSSEVIQDLTVSASGVVFVLVGPREHVRRFGTHGDAADISLVGAPPADFSLRLGWVRDTLWVGGGRTGRFRLFTQTGASVRTVDIVTDSTTNDTYLRTGALALLCNGSGLATPQPPGTLIANMEVLGLPLVTVAESGTAIDTLAWLSTANEVMTLSDDEHQQGGVMFLRQPFRDNPIVAISRFGDMIVVVNRDHNLYALPLYRVTVLSPLGDTIFERTLTYAPIPVSKRAVTAVRREIEAVALKARTIFKDRPDVDRAIDREMWNPTYYPAIDTVIVGTDSSIWMRRRRMRTLPCGLSLVPRVRTSVKSPSRGI